MSGADPCQPFGDPRRSDWRSAMIGGTMACMPKKPAKPKKPKAKPGPKPEVLEPFDGTFEQAMVKVLSKKKPAGGWPK